jgi:putative photosynthetic complex assembly protein 2
MLWGWHEVSFLTGWITGSRRTPRGAASPDPQPDPAPFRQAAETVIHHEIAIALTALALAAALSGSGNLVAIWTFGVLWIMRLSAKLNIYLGVRNLAEHFLPDHLAYLKSYFCRRPMNALFPLSVTAGTIGTVLIFIAASTPGATAGDVAGLVAVGTMVALGTLEHWLMVVPLSADRLWAWGLKSRRGAHPRGHAPLQDRAATVR